jgi:selenocysteine lyase/cysteine desulfurase
MTPAELRQQFPALRQWTWLNAAASSPTSGPALAAMEAYLRETAESGDLQYAKWARFREGLRARLAAYVGAAAKELAFVPTTSFGFNVIGRMLLARGQTEVLTLEGEFPSTVIPLLHSGLTLRVVKSRPDGTWPLAAIEAALRPTTNAIAVSIVQYASGYRVDLTGLAALSRARGLTLILNGAQALGQVPIDLAALGASFFAAPGQKWFFAGYGLGTLVIRQDWLDAVPLPLGGWLSVAPAEQYQSWLHTTRVDDEHGFVATGGALLRKEASALEVGAGSLLGLHAMDASLQLHEAVGTANVLSHNIALQLELRRRLRERGFAPRLPDDPTFLSGICVLPVQGDPAEVVRALVREHQVMTTPRGGGVRISTHGYNSLEDVDRVVRALDALGVKPAAAAQ